MSMAVPMDILPGRLRLRPRLNLALQSIENILRTATGCLRHNVP